MTDLDSRPPSRTRRERKPIWVAAAVVLIIGLTVGLALFQPWKIFTRSTVNEALPVAAATQSQALGSELVTVPQLGTSAPSGVGNTDEPVASAQTSAAQTTAAQTTAAQIPAAQTPSTVPTAEEPPTDANPAQQQAPVVAGPVVLGSGTFVDGEHATSGSATILQLDDGSRFVRLEGFSTSDGPDVDVWITDQEAGGDDWGKYDDGRYIALGDLKGTDGNQNYAIPTDADLSGLTSIVIWCDRFNVAFGTAAVTLS